MINLYSITKNLIQAASSSQTQKTGTNIRLTQGNPLFIAPHTNRKPPLTATKSLNEREIQFTNTQTQPPLLRKGYKPQLLQEQIAVQNQVHQDIALTLLEEPTSQKHKQLLNKVFDDPSIKTLLKKDPELERASSVSELRHIIRSSGSSTPSSTNSKSRRNSECSSNTTMPISQSSSLTKTTSMDEISWKQQSLTHLREQRGSALKTVNAAIAEISEKRIFPNTAQDRPQLTLNEKQYHTLIKRSNTEHYELLSHNGISRPANGYYIFAVSEAEPTRIRCLSDHYIERENRTTAGHGLTKGHTSLTAGDPVLAAGVIYFEKSNLLHWDNGSGHYATRASLMLRNIAHLKHLLPRNKFSFTFEDVGHSGYRVFLNNPTDKPLPPELKQLIDLNITRIPKSCHKAVQDTANLYQILHQLKYALEQQIKNNPQALLLPDVYSQQTLKDILHFQQLDPNAGTSFLAAYLDILSLSIQNKWLNAEEIFYNITYKPPQSPYSFIEKCAELSHRHTLLARKHAQLIGKIFQSQAIDSENFIQTLLGHHNNPPIKHEFPPRSTLHTLIGQTLLKINHPKPNGGYFLLSLQKKSSHNNQTAKTIYNMLSTNKVISEITNHINILNTGKRKKLIKNIKYFAMSRKNIVPKRVTSINFNAMQAMSDLLTTISIKKSLHNQMRNLDQQIKNALIESQFSSYLKCQQPNITDIWEIKTESYIHRNRISAGDSLHIQRQKINDKNYIRKLPNTFYQNLLKEFKQHPQINKLVRMQALQDYEPLAILNTLEAEKALQKKADTQKTLIEVSCCAAGDTLGIINNELQKHLKNNIVPNWGKP